MLLQNFPGIDSGSSRLVDTPLPFTHLKKLWYELIDFDAMTFEGIERDQPTLQQSGDPGTLRRTTYKPHAMGAAGPFSDTRAFGIQRPLDLLDPDDCSDPRYNFLLRPGPWEPDASTGKQGKVDLDAILAGWLGGEKPITILDLAGIPSNVLERLLGSILKIVYASAVLESRKNGGRHPTIVAGRYRGGSPLPVG